MNRQIRLVGLGIMVLFVALFLQLNWVQIVHAPALEANPLNTRAVVKEYSSPRGNIISADGTTLAESVPTNDELKYLRRYPTGSLFEQITGYFSFTYGSDGVERSTTRSSRGPAVRSSCRPASANCEISLPITTKARTSRSPWSTISRRSPKPSWPAGRVRSSPSILGTATSCPCTPTRPSIRTCSRGTTRRWSRPTTRPSAPHRASSHPAVIGNGGSPGSTFKIITASAVYDHQPSLATTVLPTLSALPLPQTTNLLHNFGGESLRRGAGGSVHRVVRHRFCSARSGPGAQRSLSGGLRLRLQSDSPHRSPLRGSVDVPSRRQLYPGPTWPGLFGHRSAERPGHAVANGAGRRSRRRWWDDHDPARAVAYHQLPEPDREHLPTEALAAGHQRSHRRAGETTDDLGRQFPQRNRRCRSDTGNPGGRQDGHRPNRNREDR